MGKRNGTVASKQALMSTPRSFCANPRSISGITIPSNDPIFSTMDEGESTRLLAESVFQRLEVVERSARSHQHQHIARISVHSILVVKAKFQTAFRAPPTSARADKRQFLPIISKCDHIKGILLEDDIKVKLGQYYTQFRASIQDAEKLLGGIIAVLMEPAGDHVVC